MKAVGHDGHFLNVPGPSGDDGVAHGCGQIFQKEAFEKNALRLAQRQAGPHVLEELRGAAN